MIDSKAVQLFLQRAGFYKGTIDGDFGRQSRAATTAFVDSLKIPGSGTWTDQRRLNALNQAMINQAKVGVTLSVDGIFGPQSQYALELYQNHLRDVTAPPELVALQPRVWPRQVDVRKFYGEPGQNQAMLASPYPLHLDWDLSTTVKRFSIHEKCHDSAERVMKRVLSEYGLEKIQELGLNQFGGCLNVRKMRGGQAMSMHSWGIAIDWDADRNQLRWGRDLARMAKPQYARFLDLWAEEGWISLGRERNYDWMHVQAARL